MLLVSNFYNDPYRVSYRFSVKNMCQLKEAKELFLLRGNMFLRCLQLCLPFSFAKFGLSI